MPLATVVDLTIHRKPHAADPDIVARHAATLTPAAQHCRFRGHAWKDHTVKQRRWGYEVTEICRDCGATVLSELDRHGYERSRGAIRYPPGYLLPPGTGRITPETRAVYRLAARKRRTPP